jgi:hypothetical protein
MAIPWPTFSTWTRIQEPDRAAISDILSDLLAHGALIGETGRDRELYLLAREYQREISEYLAPLHLELWLDPDRPILQARPVPGDCSLMARFNKAETLLVLTLWRMYHDQRLERVVSSVFVSANDVWEKLRLYFDKIAPPTEAQLREMLAKLRNRRLVRIQWNEDSDRFGESQLEILPTLPRVIPFENPEAWRQQAALYQTAASEVVEPQSKEEQL